MLVPLILGCATVFVSMGIQIAAVVYMLQYLFKSVSETKDGQFGKGRMTYIISMIMMMLFVGHVVQVAIWAVLFMVLGEFSDFPTEISDSRGVCPRSSLNLASKT